MNNQDIEVEIRSFVSDKQYNAILSKLEKTAKYVSETEEETVYFSSDKDLRLRRNRKEASIILKEGKIHDNFRKEYEVKFNVVDFEKMEDLLKSLGYEIKIKWFRRRLKYEQDDVKIFLDETRGYGKIIEIEKMVNLGEEKIVYKNLENRLKDFDIKITSKDEFNSAFEYYKNNWESLIK